jgi:DNA polymerase IV
VEDSFMQEAPRPANRGRSPGRESSDSPKPDSRSGKASDEGYGDALSAAIGQAKAFEHLPLDFEEDEVPSRPNTSEGLETDSEDERPTKKPKILVAQSGKFNQSDFQCMYKHDGTTIYENPNERTIEILQEMGKYYDLMQDQWRTLAYRKAVATLKKQTKRITTKEEAVRLPNIGERLAAKIEEISMTNSLCRLESTRTDSMDENLRLFLGIYGVGLTQAHKWIQQGYKTLEDLKEKAHLIKNQIIGIEHYDDFATRIPRIEVEMHGNYVQKALQKIDPGFEVTIMGSYRRKAKTSSDIDLIITKPKASIDHIRNTVVDELVPELIKQDFLKVGLATTHKDTGSKWHGASAIPGAATWRRIDLFLVPWSEMGAALIYFTGNDLFNRSIRLLARKKGMRLNQRGLYKDVMRGQNRANITEGTLLESRSEKRIFEILGVPWRSPHDRQI